jgi:hypothetical protein
MLNLATLRSILSAADTISPVADKPEWVRKEAGMSGLTARLLMAADSLDDPNKALALARELVATNQGDASVAHAVGFTCSAQELVDWCELLMGSFPETKMRHGGDLCIRGFSGWWLYGVHRTPGKGYLVIDQEEYRGDLAALEPFEASLDRGELTQADLPQHVYLVDGEACIRALKWGREQWGRRFDDGTEDYNAADSAVQVALLGEVVYG